VPTASADETKVAKGPINRLLSLTGRGRDVEPDPFIDAAEPASQKTTSTAARTVQTEAERLKELDALAQAKKNAAEAGKPADALLSQKSGVKEQVTRTSNEAEQIFADLAKPKSPAAESASAAHPESAAEPLITAERRKKAPSVKPADELEELIARDKSTRASRKESTSAFEDMAAAAGESSKLQLASAQETAAAEPAEENYAEMFRALQAGFETPASDQVATSAPRSAAAETKKQSANPASAFDSLLVGKPQPATVRNPASTAAATAAGFDELMGAAKSATQAASQVANRTRTASELLGGPVVADSGNQRTNRTDENAADFFAGRDPFAEIGLAAAQTLADEAEFQWKEASDARESVARLKESAEQAWGETAARANSAVAQTDAFLNATAGLRNSSAGSGAFNDFPSQGFGNEPAGGHADSRMHTASAASDSRRSGPPVRTSTLTRDPGFEDEPPFDTASFSSDFGAAKPASMAVVTAADHAPVVSVSGQVQSVSMRTWGLLAGGIIVAILLFAPKRKPLQAERNSASQS
jgi:hypothetical protein